MTTDPHTTQETHRKHDGHAEPTALGAVQGAVHEVRGALVGAGRSVPAVVGASRSAIGDLYRVIDSGSDERIAAGVTLSLGLAIGMLIGGAPRLLIALALAPLVAMGLVLADRQAAPAKVGPAA